MIRDWLAAAAVVLAATASAQESKPIRIVVPVPAGGSLDTTARLITAHWQTRGTTALVDNKPGANTLIGADFVARAAPDGTTLLYTSTPIAIAPSMQKTSFQPDSIVPVIQVSNETFGLVAKKGGGIDSAADLAQVSASRADGINCIAVPGAPEIACEELRARLGGKSTTVPYAGLAPAATALLGGHGDVMFSPMVTIMPLLRGGQVRLLAVSSRAGLPEGVAAPLLSEQWNGFVLDGFTGVFVPRGTPEERVRQLNREIDAILREPEVRAAMQANAQAPVGGEPQVLAEQMRSAQRRYQDIIVRLKLAPR